MSAVRFKSKDDYFAKKSNLTKAVIITEPKKSRKRIVDSSFPVLAMRNLFCKTVDRFEIEGEGRFSIDTYSLDDALEQLVQDLV